MREIKKYGQTNASYFVYGDQVAYRRIDDGLAACRGCRRSMSHNVRCVRMRGEGTELLLGMGGDQAVRSN